MIVAQARKSVFYRSYGVPDTVEGRLDMIVLHLFLLLRALPGVDGESALGQELFDRFCRDIDDNFREMGVGDLAVPKRMQRVAEAFYGRARVYESALVAADPAQLEAAVARNVFGTNEPPLGARRLADYMRRAGERLMQGSPEAWIGGGVAFPDPSDREPDGADHETNR